MKGCFNSFLDFLLALIVIFLLLAILDSEAAEEPDTSPVPELKRLPPPPIISPAQTAEEPASWVSSKLQWLEPCHSNYRELMAACDYRKLRNSVLPILHPSNAGPFNLGKACDIFDHLSQWEYHPDPIGEEYFARASNSWRLLSGDCDDYAICMAAGVIAIGGQPRVFFSEGPEGAHAYTEVFMGNLSKKEVAYYLAGRYGLEHGSRIHFKTDNDGNLYLNFDWSAGHPGGPYFEETHGQVFYPIQKKCTELQ